VSTVIALAGTNSHDKESIGLVREVCRATSDFRDATVMAAG
jgi:hypothetical protein